MLYGRRRQALVRLGFGVFAQARRRSGLVSVAAVVALVLAGPVGAGSMRSAQVVGVAGPSDVPGTSWSGIVAITENTQNFTYSGTDHVTFHLDGTGATSCGAGCYLQSFTWEADLARVYGTFCGPETWLGAGSGSVAQGANTGMTLSFASPGSFYDGTWSAGFLPHQTYSANYSGFSGAECSEPYSHNTLVLTLDPSIGGGISAGWFPEAPSFDAPTMHGSHVNELNLGGAHTSDTYVWSLTRYPDLDHDGVPNFEDNCPTAYNPDQADSDHDGKGDACADADNDGVPDDHDNCKSTANPGQVDTDSDGKGDACDSDIDGDGIDNDTDPCPLDLLNACDDGDGGPPPPSGCSQEDARVLFVEHDAGIPKVHLFDYDTIVRYRVCEDDGTVTVTGISDFENIDFGLTTLGLALLGFDFEALPSTPTPTDSNPDPQVADVYAAGGFYMTFDLKGFIAQKVGGEIAGKLTERLLKVLPKKDIAEWPQIILADIDKSILAFRKAADRIDEWLRSKRIPRALAEVLEDAVEGPLNFALAAWREKVASTNLGGKTVDEAVSGIIQTLAEVVFKPLKGEVWLPSIHHRITASTAAGMDEGWHNPLLSITRKRNEVVT